METRAEVETRALVLTRPCLRCSHLPRHTTLLVVRASATRHTRTTAERHARYARAASFGRRRECVRAEQRAYEALREAARGELGAAHAAHVDGLGGARLGAQRRRIARLQAAMLSMARLYHGYTYYGAPCPRAG